MVKPGAVRHEFQSARSGGDFRSTCEIEANLKRVGTEALRPIHFLVRSKVVPRDGKTKLPAEGVQWLAGLVRNRNARREGHRAMFPE